MARYSCSAASSDRPGPSLTPSSAATAWLTNPARTGTKAALHWQREIQAGGQATLRLRLCDPAIAAAAVADPFGAGFDRDFATRRTEADEFYAAIIPGNLSADELGAAAAALTAYLNDHNAHRAHPYRWTYTGQPLVRAAPFSQTRQQQRFGRAWFGSRPQPFDRLEEMS